MRGDRPQQVSSGDHSWGPDNPLTVRTVGGTEVVVVLRSRSGGGGGNPAWGPERLRLAHRCTNSHARASCSASPAPVPPAVPGWDGGAWGGSRRARVRDTDPTRWHRACRRSLAWAPKDSVPSVVHPESPQLSLRGWLIESKVPAKLLQARRGP